MDSANLAAPLRKGILVLLAIAALVAAADGIGLFHPLDIAAYHLAFRLRGPRQPDPRVLLVRIDDRSIDKLGPWPLERSTYAAAMRRLAHAAAIGLDILFLNATDQDEALAAAISAHARVILPCHLERSGWKEPSPTIGARQLGHVYLEQDISGMVSSYAGRIQARGQTLASFAGLLAGQETDDTDATLRWINFYDGPGSFPSISLVDLLEGQAPPGGSAGRIVLFGAEATGVGDFFPTPFFQRRTGMSGVEVQATIVSNLLQNDAIRMAPFWAKWVLAMLAFAALAVMLRLTQSLGLWIWLASCLLVVTGVLLAFAGARLWLAPSIPLLLLTAAPMVSGALKAGHAHGLLQSAHAELEDVFNSITDAIVMQDRSGRVTHANHAGARMLAGEQRARFEQRWQTLCKKSDDGSDPGWNPQDPQNPLCLPGETIQEEDSQGSYEIRLLPRYDTAARCLGLVQVVRDISAQRALEAELCTLQEELSKAQKLETIGALAGGIAHDFNNVLTVIAFHLDMLQADLPQHAVVMERVQRMQDACDKGRDLVEQITKSRRQQELRESNERPVNLALIVQEVLRFLAPAIPARILVRQQLQHDVRVKADPVKIKQVVTNLVTNALRAMEGQTGLLAIELGKQHFQDPASAPLSLAPGWYARLAIADSGHGIAAEVLPHIFEPFFTTRTKEGGTGIGLSTVRSIVMGLNGTITVSSTAGSGATFTVYLPLPKSALDQAASEQAPGRDGGLLTGAATPRVLLIAPQASALVQAAPFLIDQGCHVTVWHSSLEAMTGFQAAPDAVDLAVLDEELTILSGSQLGEFLLQVRADLPVLIFAPAAKEADVENLRQQGFAHILAGPLDRATLLEQIQRLCPRAETHPRAAL